LRTDHKPFEWLATVSDAHGRRGRWIDLLQDFSFNIVHRARLRHANADALSRNLVGQAVDDEDFCQEIQDDPVTQQGMGEAVEKVLAIRPDQHLEWFEKLRESNGLAEHHRRGLGVNHGGSSDPHHIFVVAAVNVVEEREETNRGMEEIEVVEDEELDAPWDLRPLWRRIVRLTEGAQVPKENLLKVELSCSCIVMKLITACSLFS